MQKTRKNFLIKINSILGILVSFLGFTTACNGGGYCEYGMPNADFKINGNIKSENTSAIIPNIKVTMQDTSGYYSTSVNSNESGNYEIQINDFPTDNAYLLTFEDIDSTENGEYETLDTIIEFNDTEFSGGDGSWYAGETEQELNVKLKETE